MADLRGFLAEREEKLGEGKGAGGRGDSSPLAAMIRDGIAHGYGLHDSYRSAVMSLANRNAYDEEIHAWCDLVASHPDSDPHPGRDEIQREIDGAREIIAAETGGSQIVLTSLVGMVRDGVPDPVMLCDGLLYEGGMHCLSGPPDSGKTTLAFWWVLQVVRAGKKALVLDQEGGAAITADKLRSMGATAKDAALISYAEFPCLPWNEASCDKVSVIVNEVRPKIILWDSSAAFLAIAGLDENSASDVTKFWADWLSPCAREAKAAVLVIDHDPKGTEPSRYARGSGAKLAMTDVMFKLTVTTPFDREHDGLLQMKVTKDRRGFLKRDWGIEVTTGDQMKILLRKWNRS